MGSGKVIGMEIYIYFGNSIRKILSFSNAVNLKNVIAFTNNK